MHARAQIRDAVTALLKGKTSAGDHVYTAQVYPLDKPKLPAVLIYATRDDVEDHTITPPRHQTRKLSLAVELYLKSGDHTDDAIDALALKVEQLVAKDPSLDGRVKDIMLSSTEIRFSGEGDQPIAMATLIYIATYRVRETEPQTFI